MLREYIVSSNVDVVGYHRGKLYVRFHNGGAYEYENATLKDYLDLAHAESAGQHFHRHIRGKFPFAKLDHDPFQPHLKAAA